MLSRRDFLATSVAAAVSGPLAAIEPIKRTGKPNMRLSLAAYSFRQWLDLKKATAKPPMTLFDFCDFAAEQQLDAVELTGYYFAETTKEYFAKLKLHCTRLGLDVNGTAVGNDFCVKEPEALKKQIAMVHEGIEHCAALGGKTIRVFAGKVPKGDTEEEARKRAIEHIHNACEFSKKFGVYVALENHHGIVASAEQMLAIVTAVKHDFFGVNLDTGNFNTKDPYGDLAKLVPYAVNVQVKTEINPEGKGKQEADLPREIKMLKDANYRGYVVLEYEAKEDAKVAVPKYLKELRGLMAG